MSVKPTETILRDVVIKFAGDSGDGMQLTGSQFTNSTAMLGIDLATFPDFPAELLSDPDFAAGSEGTSGGYSYSFWRTVYEHHHGHAYGHDDDHGHGNDD